MGGLAPGKLKSRRGGQVLSEAPSLIDSAVGRDSRTHWWEKLYQLFRDWRTSHRHRLAAPWLILARQSGPLFRRRRHFDSPAEQVSTYTEHGGDFFRRVVPLPRETKR